MKSPFSIVAILTATVAFAQGTADDYQRALTIRDRWRDQFANASIVPHWLDGGDRFWYEARRGSGKETILVDCLKGTKTVVKPAELPKAEANPPRRSPVDQPRYSLAVADSPDRKWNVFVKDSNLWRRDTKSGRETQFTFDGNPLESFDKDIYWSPDAKFFAAFTIRPGADRRVTIVESSPVDQVQPRVITYPYLKPGDTLPTATLRLFSTESWQEIPLDRRLFADPWAIDRFTWTADSKRFTFLYNQRGHQVMRLIGIDLPSGTVKAIVDESCETFFDYSNKTYLRHLPGGDILWMSERSGWNHLYRIDGNTGALKNPVTQGEFVVRAVERFDETNGTLRLRVMGLQKTDPYFAETAVVNIDGTGFKVITHGEGIHDTQWSPNRKYFLDTVSQIDSPPVHTLRDADGKEIVELEKCDASAAMKAGWKPVHPFALPGRDGKTMIHGIIVRPSNFDASKKYPVIEHIYAGPHDYFTPKRFSPTVYESAMAELGFIVVKMDGMGTNWRSRAFHDVAWKNLADSGFPDRIAVHKQLAKQFPEMDYSKGCGLFGGSAGGQSTVAGLLYHGEFYTVGVADCGCHDNRMDKVWWNEAWMGTVGPHYGEQSNVTNAHKLKGKLMLVVGEVDRNVDPASTMQVVNALVKADRDFELLVMPGVGHGAAETPYANRRRMDFFVRHLMGKEPRK